MALVLVVDFLEMFRSARRANVKQRIFSPFDLHQTSAKAAHRSEARDRPRPVLRGRNRTDQARDDVEARTSMSALGHKRTFL